MSDQSWIVQRRGGSGATVRLVCLPYAGGGASIYRSWPDGLPASIAVWPVELPGRETRFVEPVYTDLGTLASDLAEVLAPATRDLPLALFGHSMGALLAFEVARRLFRHHGV